MPLLNFLIDLIAAVALVYVAVALILSLSTKFAMPRPKIAPGQMTLDFAAVESIAVEPLPAAQMSQKYCFATFTPIAVEPAAEETEDVWSVEVEPIAPTVPAVVPMFHQPPYLLLLPAAAEMHTDAQTEPPAVVPNWAD